MAEKYHLSPSTGNPNRCYAKKRCPLGASEDEHYPSKEAARAAFEQTQSASSLGGVSKKKAKAASSPVTKAGPSPEDLRESVRDYRAAETTEAEREYIRSYWTEQGVKNQFMAMLKAAEIEKESAATPEVDAAAWDLTEEEPQQEVVPLDPDDDFSDIKCDDCGKPLDHCICGECEFCGAQENEDHEDDCPLAKPKGYRYSWE